MLPLSPHARQKTKMSQPEEAAAAAAAAAGVENKLGKRTTTTI